MLEQRESEGRSKDNRTVIEQQSKEDRTTIEGEHIVYPSKGVKEILRDLQFFS